MNSIEKVDVEINNQYYDEIKDVKLRLDKSLNIDIEKSKYFKSPDLLLSSYLELKMSGDDLNLKIINGLRRTVRKDLPMYGFTPELINIVENTSIAYNNDMMKLRLSMLPVIGLKPDIFFLHEKYWNKINYNDTKREKHESEQIYEIYIDYHNTSSSIYNLTTADAKVFLNGDEIKPYKSDVLLIPLTPNDKFKCDMRASLGVGDRHVIWGGAIKSFYTHTNDNNKSDTNDDSDTNDVNNEYLLTVYANWQCTEKELLINACKYLITKLNFLKNDLENKMKNKQINNDNKLELILDNEDYTISEIINYEFQSHPDIKASGNTRPDHLIKSMLIKIESNNNESPINAILESIDICIKKISHIGKLISNLNL